MPRFALAFVVFASVGPVASCAEPAAPVSYYRDIRPLFQQQCQGCHQPAKPFGDYVMTDFASLFKAGESEEAAIVPGKPEASYLVGQIATHGGKAEMPKGRDALKAADYELVVRWIKDGAKDDTPASAKEPAYDAEHPPGYVAPPVVTSLAFSPDGKLLAATGYHEIVLHHADGSGVVARLVGLSESVQSLAFSPDGSRLAAAGGSPGRFGEVQVWDVAKRKLTLSLPVTFDTVYGISWSPDGTRLGFGCGDNTVRAVDAATGKQILYMGTHSDWVLETVFSQDGQHLASVSRDMSMKLTEVPTQRFVDNVTSITPGALKGGLMSVDRRPLKTRTDAKKSPDTPDAPPRVYDELVCAGSDGKPRLYKMHREVARVIGDDANRLKEFAAMPGRVAKVRFDPAGERFAAVSSLEGKGEARIYTVASGEFKVCEKVPSAVYAVAWAADGKTVAVAGFAGRVGLYDAATGKLAKEFDAVPLGK